MKGVLCYHIPILSLVYILVVSIQTHMSLGGAPVHFSFRGHAFYPTRTYEDNETPFIHEKRGARMEIGKNQTKMVLARVYHPPLLRGLAAARPDDRVGPTEFMLGKNDGSWG